MKKLIILLQLTGPLAYLCKFPYLLRAWRTSPLDRWDFLALPAALLAAAIALRNTRGRRNAKSLPPRKLTAAVVSALCFLAMQAATINSLAVLGAIAFWWSCCFAAMTPVGAFSLLPAFLLLGLGCASSTYWIGYFLSIPTGMVFGLKALSAAVILSLSVLRVRIRIEATAFTALLLIGLVAWHYNSTTDHQIAGPLFLAPRHSSEHCLVREIPPEGSSARFFRNSRMRSFLLADERNVYHLLEISEVRDIHDIHPASHCLRSSGWRILSEKTEIVKVRGRRFPITLIASRRRGERGLFAVWYTDCESSCGRYLAFRRRWRRGHEWYIYQISVRVTASPEEARRDLEAMINVLASPAPELPQPEKRGVAEWPPVSSAPRQRRCASDEGNAGNDLPRQARGRKRSSPLGEIAIASISTSQAGRQTRPVTITVGRSSGRPRRRSSSRTIPASAPSRR